VSGDAQFDALYTHFDDVSNATKAILLHTFGKMINLYPDQKELLREAIKPYASSIDMELQQRAVEYSIISTDGAMTQKIFDFIPPFAKDKKSGLIAKLSKDNSKTADRNVWASREAKEEVEQSVRAKSAPVAAAAAAPKPVQETQAAPPEPLEDSLIDFSDNTPTGLDPAATAVVAKHYRDLLTKNSGLIIENSFLQIGIKMQFQAHQGRLTLFFGNKSTSPLLGCELVIGSVDGLKLQLGPTPPKILPKSQVKVSIAITCMKPFSGSPSFDLKFSHSGTAYHWPLQLPIVATKFMSGTPLDLSVFQQRWQSLAANRTVESTVRSEKPVDVSYWSTLVSKALGLYIVPTPTVVTAAGLFLTGTKKQQQFIKVGTLLRLQPNPDGTLLVTVKAVHPAVAAATHEILAEIIGGRQTKPAAAAPAPDILDSLMM